MAAAAVQQVEEEALPPEAATAARQVERGAAPATPAPSQLPSNIIIIISITSGTSRRCRVGDANVRLFSSFAGSLIRAD
jgi:hypothetical protein